MAQKSGNKLSKLMSTAPVPAPAENRRWEAEDALRTLTRAAEIQANAPLMREVKKVASEQVKTLSRFAKRPGAK